MFEPPSKETWAGQSIPFDPKFTDYYKAGWNDAVAGKPLNYPFPKDDKSGLKRDKRTVKDDFNYYYFLGFYSKAWK